MPSVDCVTLVGWAGHRVCKLLEQFLRFPKSHILSQAHDGVWSSSSEWPSFTQNHSCSNTSKLWEVLLQWFKFAFALSESCQLSFILGLILGNNGVCAGLAKQHRDCFKAGCFYAVSSWRQCESWLRRGL